MGGDASKGAPAQELSFTSLTELSAYSYACRHDCWAVTKFKAPIYQREARVPIDVIAVIDQSGSMAGEKMTRVKRTLSFVIDQLQKCDRLSLVTYDAGVYVKFQLLSMSGRNKERAKEVVSTITPGTSTNLCAGLLVGMQEIAYNSGSSKAKVQSVLLLTDGLATDGVTTKEGILAEMLKIQSPEDKSKKCFDGTVYTFGFGSDHDGGLLEAISSQGGGVYYFIDSNEKIPQSFADCLGGLLSVVGQNLSLKLEAQGDYEFNEVHANRVNWITAKKCCEVSLGDLQSEEERDVVFQLVLPALAAPSQDAVIKSTLTFFNVFTSTMETVSHDLVIIRADANSGEPDLSVDEQRNRIVTANAINQGQALADKGSLDRCRSVLGDAIAQIEQSVSSKNKFSKALVTDLKKTLASLASREQYLSHGQHLMFSKAQSHFVQRSNYVDEEASCYTSTAKSGYIEASRMS